MAYIGEVSSEPLQQMSRTHPFYSLCQPWVVDFSEELLLWECLVMDWMSVVVGGRFLTCRALWMNIGHLSWGLESTLKLRHLGQKYASWLCSSLCYPSTPSCFSYTFVKPSLIKYQVCRGHKRSDSYLLELKVPVERQASSSWINNAWGWKNRVVREDLKNTGRYGGRTDISGQPSGPWGLEQWIPSTQGGWWLSLHGAVGGYKQ